MKNIVNWTFGGFFRTIGRILAYLGIGALIFLFISKYDVKGILIPRLNALQSDSNIVYIDYNSPVVINNQNKSFFGDYGLLEQTRSVLNQYYSSGSYLITYTNNDINVIWSINPNRNFYFTSYFSPPNNNQTFPSEVRSLYSDYVGYFAKDSNNPNNDIYSNTWAINYKRFSDFNGFKNCLINHDRTSCLLPNNYNSPSYTGNSLIFYIERFFTSSMTMPKAYNYFYLEPTYYRGYLGSFNTEYRYSLPYYTNKSLYDSLSSLGCTNNGNYPTSCSPTTSSDYTYYSFNLTNSSNKISTYYDLYSSNVPNINDSSYNKTLYKNSFTILTEHLEDSWQYQYSFNYSGNSYTIDHIDYYGLINDNGLYHYELINDKIEISYIDFECSNGYCEFNTNNANILTNGDLSNYQKIYFDIVYTNNFSLIPDSYKFSRSIPYIVDSIVNDVCSTCLFIQLESSSGNTYTFSNSDSTKNTIIFYNNILSNDLIYNSPSFIDFSNGTFFNDVNITTNDYYYGFFNKVLYDNYKIANNIGLVMNLYSVKFLDNPLITDISGSYQILYFITPNIYWGDSSYSSDRNSINYVYTNDSGDNLSGTANGDFNNYFSEFSNLTQDLHLITGLFSEDLYGLSGLLLSPLYKLSNLLSSTCTTISLPIPFTNSNLTLPCMSYVYNTYAPDLVNIWHIVVLGLVAYYIGTRIFSDIKNTLENDKNDIEVIEL